MRDRLDRVDGPAGGSGPAVTAGKPGQIEAPGDHAKSAADPISGPFRVVVQHQHPESGAVAGPNREPAQEPFLG